MTVGGSANDPALARAPSTTRQYGTDSLRGLAVPVGPLAPTASCGQAAHQFEADPTLLAIPIVESTGNPIGILNRFTFLSALST